MKEKETRESPFSPLEMPENPGLIVSQKIVVEMGDTENGNGNWLLRVSFEFNLCESTF